MGITRRRFLEGVAVTGVTTLKGGTKTLPTRTLGKTGARVSILAMGGGSRFLMYKDEDEALEAAAKAFDAGITYVDSADDYGKNHLGERRLGKALKGRRAGIFLATKLTNRNGAES